MAVCLQTYCFACCKMELSDNLSDYEECDANIEVINKIKAINEVQHHHSGREMPRRDFGMRHDCKINKELEKLELHELLQNDILNDPTVKPDTSFKPVQLPLQVVETTVKKEAGVKKEEIKTEIPKVNNVPEDIVIGGVRIKREAVDTDCLQSNIFDVNIKQEKLEDEPLTQEDGCGNNGRTVSDFFKTPNLRYFFLQLPDSLPGFKPEADSGPAWPSTSKDSSPTSTSGPPPEEVVAKHCTLNTLSEGLVGKLQLMKSGKARIVLNNTMLHVASSVQLGYPEDLISIDLVPSTDTGDMINLGPVECRLLCTPDWERMISDISQS